MAGVEINALNDCQIGDVGDRCGSGDCEGVSAAGRRIGAFVKGIARATERLGKKSDLQSWR